MVNDDNNPVSEVAVQLGLTHQELDNLHLFGRFSEPEVRGLLILLRSRLLALVGDDPENLAHWLHDYNLALEGVPLELIQTSDGFLKVIKYLNWFIAR